MVRCANFAEPHPGPGFDASLDREGYSMSKSKTARCGLWAAALTGVGVSALAADTSAPKSD